MASIFPSIKFIFVHTNLSYFHSVLLSSFLCILQRLLGVHGSLVHIIYQAHSALLTISQVLLGALLNMQLQSLMRNYVLAHYYTTPSIHRKGVTVDYNQVKYVFENATRLCTYCIQERGIITAHFCQEHDTHTTETGKLTYKALTLHGRQLLFKRD